MSYEHRQHNDFQSKARPLEPAQPEIPWALSRSDDLHESVSSLLEEIGCIDYHPPLVDFIDDTPVIPTPLHIGRAAATVIAACGHLFSAFALKRGLEDKGIVISVRQSELFLMGVFAAQVNGKGIVRSSLTLPSIKQHSQLGILKTLPFCRIERNADQKWFHTHGNFNCNAIKAALGSTTRRFDIKKSIGRRNAQELEDQLAKANALGTLFRTPEEWSIHPHGKSLLQHPCVEIEKIRDGKPLKAENTYNSPLEDLRVLDITRVLAGPACARILSAYGAECLKITAPHLPFYPFFSQVENQGKRSANLDFRDTKQQEELRTLAKSADILINSYRPGALNSLGLDPLSTTALNPNGMIYVSISCYGPGPWSDRGGYDSLAQAATGYSLAHSGLTSSMDQKPSLVPMSAPNDYICAFLAVAGILTALQRRQEEGGSFHVKVSLAQAAMWTMKFGYRDKPHRSQLTNVFGSNLLDFSSLKEAKQFLQVQRSDFGEISSLKIPIHFKNPKIKERYRHPSVAFGTHLPTW
ncbi:hypothetical protein A9Q81_06480 [Gammaproteobacteria bacterium 42_54_T18]|nr:hypothetical protein A9Q81_06480 [Gammaproteobacteria bacterium 42_54_T18]